MAIISGDRWIWTAWQTLNAVTTDNFYHPLGQKFGVLTDDQGPIKSAIIKEIRLYTQTGDFQLHGVRFNWTDGSYTDYMGDGAANFKIQISGYWRDTFEFNTRVKDLKNVELIIRNAHASNNYGMAIAIKYEPLG